VYLSITGSDDLANQRGTIYRCYFTPYFPLHFFFPGTFKNDTNISLIITLPPYFQLTL